MYNQNNYVKKTFHIRFQLPNNVGFDAVVPTVAMKSRFGSVEDNRSGTSNWVYVRTAVGRTISSAFPIQQDRSVDSTHTHTHKWLVY